MASAHGNSFNLIAATLESFSPYTLAEYEDQSRGMSLYLLDRAFQVNPILRGQVARVHRIFDEIVARNDERRLWRDSDLYHPIFTLIETASDGARSEELLRRLEIHLGLRPVDELGSLSQGIYRLLSLTGRVWRAERGRVTAVAEKVFTSLDDSTVLVYLPRRGLFNDILPLANYPLPVKRRAGDDVLLDRLGTALRMLRDIAPETWADFEHLISTIVLVPDEPGRLSTPTDPQSLRWSYNLRLRYFGGVFMNAYPVDAYGVLEGLLHEYFHQRLWQWWELERPSGIPERSVMMVSPISGLERPAYVMVQALLVYVGAYELYDRLTRSPLFGQLPPTDWLHARIDHLRQRIPRLHEALSGIVEPGTMIRAFLDFLLERFAATTATETLGLEDSGALCPGNRVRYTFMSRDEATPSNGTGEDVMTTPDEAVGGCGILLHQRPMLQDLLKLDDPRALLFFETWFGTPDEEITDESLAGATTTLDGKNLLFLKALVDGRPEIINIELEAGRFLTAGELTGAQPVICVHQSNDPRSGFDLRSDIREVKILAPIRNWTLYSHKDPTRVGVPARRS